MASDVRVVLFGGTGLIGNLLCAKLIEQKYRVRIVAHNTRPKDRQGTEVVWLSQGIKKALEGQDIVINLAGDGIANGRWTKAKKKRISTSRIPLTEAIATAIATMKSSPKVFLSASAVGIYGGAKRAHVDESFPSGNDFMAKVCSDWELATKKATQKARVVVLRIGIVLSMQAGALAELVPHFRLGLGGHMGDGKQGFPWIHADDVVGIIMHSLKDKSIKGPINLTAPTLISFKQFTKALAKTLKRPHFFPKPKWLIKSLVGAEKSTLVLEGNFITPKMINQSKYTFLHPTITNALEDLLETNK